jgi:hypothetical protein
MQYIQCFVLAVASAALFVHLICGAGLLSPNTKIHVYLPLCLLIAFDVGVFVCSIAGALDMAKEFATLAFVSGGVYAIVLYCNGVVVHKCLDESSS